MKEQEQIIFLNIIEQQIFGIEGNKSMERLSNPENIYMRMDTKFIY